MRMHAARRHQARAGGRCRRMLFSAAIRSVSAGACSISPVAKASLMRGRSCITTRPAPILRWPTSELPICPSGRPTSRPEVRRNACGPLAHSRSKVGRVGLADGVVGRAPRASPSRPAPPASRGGVFACSRSLLRICGRRRATAQASGPAAVERFRREVAIRGGKVGYAAHLPASQPSMARLRVRPQ